MVGVHLPLFSELDVAALIAKGARETGFTFKPSTVARIVVLARGMPYMAQLLALRLAQATALRDSTLVSDEDFDTAVAGLLADANPRVLVLFSELTTHGQDRDMVAALRHVATASQDPWGRLAVMNAGNGAVSIAGHFVSAECWSRLQTANVLHPFGACSGLYVFAERSLMHHVLLHAAHDSPMGAANAVPENAATSLLSFARHSLISRA